MYHEADDSFYIGIGRSRSERLLFIHAGEWGVPAAVGISSPCLHGFAAGCFICAWAEPGRQARPHASCALLGGAAPHGSPSELQVLSAGSAVTSDIRYLPADEPHGEWKVVLPRTHETE